MLIEYLVRAKLVKCAQKIKYISTKPKQGNV